MELPTRDEGKEKKAGDRSAWHKSLDDIEMIKRKERRKQTATAVYLNQPVCKIDGWNRLVTFDLETSRSTYEGYPQTSLSGISRERERKTGFCRGVSFLEILVSFHRVRVIRRILKRLPMIHRPNENSRLLLSGSPLWITATRDQRGSRRWKVRLFRNFEQNLRIYFRHRGYRNRCRNLLSRVIFFNYLIIRSFSPSAFRGIKLN